MSKSIKIGDKKDCVNFLYQVQLMRFEFEVSKNEFFEIVEHLLEIATNHRKNNNIEMSNKFIKKAVILAQTYLCAMEASKKTKKNFRILEG